MKHEIISTCHYTTKICFGRAAGLYLRLQWLFLNLSLFWIIRLTYFRSFPTEVLFSMFISSFFSIVLGAWLYSVLFSGHGTASFHVRKMVSKTELLYERYLLSLSNVKTHIGETIWQVYVTSELKIELFCFFTIGTMVWIFIGVNFFNFFGCTKIHNDSKWTKNSWNKLMQSTVNFFLPCSQLGRFWQSL